MVFMAAGGGVVAANTYNDGAVAIFRRTRARIKRWWLPWRRNRASSPRRRCWTRHAQ